MQASKIDIGPLYAVRLDGGELVRFRVTEVVTRRSGAGPAHSKSTVYGIFDTPTSGGSISGKPLADIKFLLPDQLLGPHKEFAELVAKEKAAADEKKKAAAERTAFVEKVRLALYEATATTAPAPASSYTKSGPFEVTYSDSINVSFEGLKLLAPLLAKLKTAGR